MPTNRTRRTRGMRQDKGYAALSEARMLFLFDGQQIFDHLDPKWTDDAEIKECWLRHRDAVMQQWQKDNRKPGRRPWAWWWFEHGCKAPLTLAGSPKEAQALLDMGELQQWEADKLTERNEPLVDKNKIIQPPTPATGKGTN